MGKKFKISRKTKEDHIGWDCIGAMVVLIRGTFRLSVYCRYKYPWKEDVHLWR